MVPERRASVAALAALLLAGCSMAPAYHPPEVATPVAFKESVPGWSAAAPSQAGAAWWQAFNDPVLDDLETRAATASPTLAAALARHDAALAEAGVARSDLFPEIGVAGSAERQRVSAHAPTNTSGVAKTLNTFTVGGALSYELDLWGRVRNGVKAANGEADATADDLAAARLSLQSSVADAYARLRGLDAEADLLRESVAAFDRAYKLTATRHDGGIASGIDVNRAKTTLSDARAVISQIAAERAQTEHELAALTGVVPAAFAVAPVPRTLGVPAWPMVLPSELVQHRPDVAAAERRLYAANARIGVARAAWFPSLSLGAAGGWQTTQGSLVNVPNAFWALGPAAAALTLFDGGRRAAGVRLSRAQYDELAAGYRSSVLGAFREVEDALANTRDLAQQAVDQRDAAQAARATSELAFTRYRDGASDYLEVVIAQTEALSAQRALIAVETARARNAVALVRATGGSLAKAG